MGRDLGGPSPMPVRMGVTPPAGPPLGTPRSGELPSMGDAWGPRACRATTLLRRRSADTTALGRLTLLATLTPDTRDTRRETDTLDRRLDASLTRKRAWRRT